MKFTAYKLELSCFYDGGGSRITSRKIMAHKPTPTEIKDFVAEEFALLLEIAQLDFNTQSDYICGMNLKVDEQDFDFPDEEAV